jgi:hypothetical protein
MYNCAKYVECAQVVSRLKKKSSKEEEEEEKGNEEKEEEEEEEESDWDSWSEEELDEEHSVLQGHFKDFFQKLSDIYGTGETGFNTVGTFYVTLKYSVCVRKRERSVYISMNYLSTVYDSRLVHSHREGCFSLSVVSCC